MLEAVKQLNSKPDITVRKVSHIYETDPVGPRSSSLRCNAVKTNRGSKQRDYFNAAVEVETVLDAQELVGVCLGIEQNMGRVRTERWGPRTIDIDILLYGNSCQLSAVSGHPRSTRGPDVTVPHPLMHTRGFVLYPLSDIAPDMVHPVIGLTISQLISCQKSAISFQHGVRKLNDLKLVF